MRSLTFLLIFVAAATASAQTQPTTNAVTVVGSVEPYWSADLYPRATGYIADVKADIGDHVKKGQLLATIDAPELEKELNAKRALAKASQASIQQFQTALEVARRRADAAHAQQKLTDATLKRQEE